MEALEGAGVDGCMTRATAAKLEAVANLNPKSLLGGVVPQDYTTGLETIEKLLAQIRQ